MAHYLIEFRFFGKAKKDAKNLIWEVNKGFHIRPRFRPVPHVTLVGPFSTRDQGRLVRDFNKICSNQGLMKFKVDGYGTFEQTRVVYIDIKPDEKLNEFRWELSKTLKPYCNLNSYDFDRKFNFHATIAMKIHPNKFEQVKRYVNFKSKPVFKHILLRVSLLRNQKILYEYDFILRRLLTRWQAKNRGIYKQTMTKLNEFFEGTHNPDEYILMPYKEPIISLSDKKHITFIDRIKGIFVKHKTFIISDLHLDHKNIIKYCNRPFKSTYEMNKTLVNNWNNVVGKLDKVYFLGDMTFGKGSRPADYWLNKLNGDIYFIKGNHEVISRKVNVFDNLIITYKCEKFFLVHDPKDVPQDWKEWVICGHHHDNHPDEHPFINRKTKMINVSVELIDYTPLDMDKLIEQKDSATP